MGNFWIWIFLNRHFWKIWDFILWNQRETAYLNVYFISWFQIAIWNRMSKILLLGRHNSLFLLYIYSNWVVKTEVKLSFSHNIFILSFIWTYAMISYFQLNIWTWDLRLTSPKKIYEFIFQTLISILFDATRDLLLYIHTPSFEFF